MESILQSSLIQYGGFKVVLRDLSDFLTTLYNNPDISYREIIKLSGVGKNKAENFRYYLRDFGLLASGIYKPTDLGRIIYSNDKRFVESFTQWVMLYNWAKASGNPLLHFVLYHNETSLARKQVEIDFVNWADSNGFKTDYKDTIPGLANRTFDALIDESAFRTLSLLTIADGMIRRTDPYSVHPLLLAYILYDTRNGRQSITINELLSEPGNIGQFFGYSPSSLENRLNDLANIGLVKRIQSANLNMVELPYVGSPLALVEQYYAEN